MLTLSSVKTQLQRGFQSTWVLWLVIAVLLPVGFGVWAVSALMRLPAPLNCDTSTGSDTESARFYCAQTVARNGSTDSLQRAIQMMSMLPQGHPLRPDGDRLMEEWSLQILAIAEEEFQNGKLDEAIDIARKIPGRVESASLANDAVEEWETVWSNAETIYADAKGAIQDRRWEVALAEARELVRIDNHYWSSTQYLALLNEIQQAKESSELAAKQESERQAKQRERTAPRSAADVLTQWEQERVTEDATRLRRAQSLASSGTVDGLQKAISEARGVVWGTEQYDEAQALIQDWQLQVELAEDQPYLDRAIALASQGDADSLRAAIQEARKIPSYRTLYDDAQSRIDAWTVEVERLTLEQHSPNPDLSNAPFSIPEADSRAMPDAPSATELFEERPNQSE
jgi:hypothetical protein